MSTLTLNTSTSSIFKSNNISYVDNAFKFLRNKNTKSNALLAYWGAETIIDGVLTIALFMSGAYLLSILAFALAAYRTYAVLGVLFDIRYI